MASSSMAISNGWYSSHNLQAVTKGKIKNEKSGRIASYGHFFDMGETEPSNLTCRATCSDGESSLHHECHYTSKEEPDKGNAGTE